ncbi:MAG: zf-HC2 domain-containing protein [Chloroflexi bacterium]|nr:zf-HC2 domain-containing protein [Chloroflexota bacterium]
MTQSPWPAAEHAGDDLLSAFVDDALVADTRRQAERHVAACASCRERLEETRAVVGALRRLPAPELPRSFTVGPRGASARDELAWRRLRRSYAFSRYVAAGFAALFVGFTGATLVVPPGPPDSPTDIRAAAPAQAAGAAASAPAPAAAPAAAPAPVAPQSAARAAAGAAPASADQAAGAASAPAPAGAGAEPTGADVLEGAQRAASNEARALPPVATSLVPTADPRRRFQSGAVLAGLGLALSLLLAFNLRRRSRPPATAWPGFAPAPADRPGSH